jgi:hypothetical protein
VKFRSVYAALLSMAFAAPALADSAVTAGGWTDEACTGVGNQNTPIVVTPSSAYAGGNEVGPLISLRFARKAEGAPARSGIMQSVTLNSKSVQTAEFDVTFFIQQPSVPTVFVDKTTPSINSADVFLVRAPVKLTANWSPFGTHTNYGIDQIARAVKLPSVVTSTPGDGFIWAVITTPGTPTFTSSSDLQLCIGMLKD